MTATLVPIAFLLSVVVLVISVSRIISEGRTRRRLIDAGASPELVRSLTAAPAGDLGLHASLQWGLVTGAVGVALVVVQFLPFNPDEPIAYGLILIFAGMGLLGYYVTGRRLHDQRGATRVP